MSPGLAGEVVEGIAKQMRSPLLVFLVVLNIITLGFVAYGVSDRRAKDHELMRAVIDQCINK